MFLWMSEQFSVVALDKSDSDIMNQKKKKDNKKIRIIQVYTNVFKINQLGNSFGFWDGDVII